MQVRSTSAGLCEACRSSETEITGNRIMVSRATAVSCTPKPQRGDLPRARCRSASHTLPRASATAIQTRLESSSTRLNALYRLAFPLSLDSGPATSPGNVFLYGSPMLRCLPRWRAACELAVWREFVASQPTVSVLRPKGQEMSRPLRVAPAAALMLAAGIGLAPCTRGLPG